MVTILSRLQGPIQAILRPALWLPGINRLHSHRERWELPENINPTDFIHMVTEAVNTLQIEDEEKKICLSKPEYLIGKTDKESGFIRIYCYTRAEWLDVVEIHLSSGQVISFSSGLIPTWFPLCFIINAVFFWAPFLDWGLNKTRLERLRTKLGLNLNHGDMNEDSPMKVSVKVDQKDAQPYT